MATSRPATFISAALRTPMGGFQGELSSLSAPQLGAAAIANVVQTAGINPAEVDEVIMGNVVSAGLRQAPARQAMRGAGLPDSTGATTINKVCGSGMKATMFASDLIAAGSAQRIVAGGMESMSNAPYLQLKARSGLRMGHATLEDAMFCDGLEDAETGRAMGTFAQATADAHQLTREEMDQYAMSSLDRARKAMAEGWLAAEIRPLQVQQRNGSIEITEDEQPRIARPERIPQLKPAFKSDGTITAANASSISDGASALLVSSEAALKSGNQDSGPVGRVVGHFTHSRAPSEFTIAPVHAIDGLLEKIGWRRDSVDLFEINEAFAMVAMLATRECGLDEAQVNIHGGACAQGHPIGSTGARLIVTLLHALQRTGGRRGIACLCIGGGEATAIAIERC